MRLSPARDEPRVRRRPRRHSRSARPSPSLAGSRHPWRLFALAWAIVFVAMALWSAATPLYAAPDEPTHVIKAAAVVRGELLGRFSPTVQESLGYVSVPAFYALPANRNSPTCFHRRPEVSAACAPSLAPAGSHEIGAWIYVARYPPLYYLVVGLPSLFGTSSWTIYLMRLVSALLCSLFVALGVLSVLLWSRRRVALVGLAAAATPMVFFLGGVVNPSGLEVAAAICVWTAGSVLVLERLDDPPPGLIALLGVSACVFELVRSLSPFWLALTALALVGVADWRRLRGLLARRPVRWTGAAAVLVGALAVAWILGEHSTAVYSLSPLGPTPESRILETSFAHNDYYLPGMVGVFGWFDTWSPTFTYVVWYGVVGLLGLSAALLARRRQALVLLLLAIAVVVLPVAISSSQVHRYGYTWSGRDTLPLAVGLPVLSAAILGRADLARHGRRLAGIVGSLLALAQFGAFFEALRRYAVGTAGADFGFLLHPSWQPPGGFALVLVPEGLLLTLGAYLLVSVQRREAPELA